MCPDLAGSLFDVIWSIQPARGHIFTWNLTSSDTCSYCGQTETNHHVSYKYYTARTFRGHARRSTNILCPVDPRSRRPCHPISVLANACGANALRTSHCRGVFQHRRSTPIFLLPGRLSVELTPCTATESIRFWTVRF